MSVSKGIPTHRHPCLHILRTERCHRPAQRRSYRAHTYTCLKATESNRRFCYTHILAIMASRYHALPNDEEAILRSSHSGGKGEESSEMTSRFLKNRTERWHWIVHAGSLATVVSLSLLLIYSYDSARVAASCWRHHNYYCQLVPTLNHMKDPDAPSAPVNTALDRYQYITTQFNGSLWYDSPFKGPPSPAVDEAWHSIMRYGMIAVTASDYRRVNHSTRTAVSFPDEAGGGYMATTVGTHQLHCLHYLWQDHHRTYYPDVVRKINDVPELYERHYEHCVDYIRQSLMCNFDVGLVTYDWVLQHQNPTPNSNAMHKCVDWNVAQTWLKNRAVEIPDGFVWKQPDGQESLAWNP